jgi:hypothetical protein
MQWQIQCIDVGDLHDEISPCWRPRGGIVPKTGCHSGFDPMIKGRSTARPHRHRVGHSTGAEAGGQTGHSTAVSKPSAMVDIVRTDHLTREFVHQVVFFVQALGRSKHADAVGTMSVADFPQSARGDFQGGVPVNLDQFIPLAPSPFAPFQQAACPRTGQAVGVWTKSYP